jgi:protein-L-isoaspartate O-methyltransferase
MHWLALFLLLFISRSNAWSPSSSTVLTRRQWLQQGCLAALFTAGPAKANDGFVSAGYSRSEYTNSITASRDTNISPKEVYDTLGRLRRGTRALDVGAGAGVSTQVLYEMGFRDIDACDWSSDAWDANVISCPDSVKFYPMDDERFVKRWRDAKGDRYDAIVFNFAINQRKAVQFATELLNEDGLLIAPVNTQDDYWLKQTYQLMDVNGKTLWSASDVGAWSVQFQPDVTQDTCQGIWCPPFNGFRKEQ